MGRRMHGLVAVATAATVAGAGAGVAHAATPAGSWAPTGTQALPLVNAQLIGAAPVQQPLRLTVGLALPDPSAVTALIHAQTTPGSTSYQQYLTPAQFTARFAPTTQQAQAVASYLTSQGFSNVGVTSNRMLVTANTTVGQAEKAFNTHINLYNQFGKTVYANSAPAEVPQELGGTVRAVLGLSDIAAATPIRVASSPKLPLTGYLPPQFQTVYNAAGTPTGAKTSIAIIAEGNLKPTIADLRYAENKEHLPKVPVTIVPTGPFNPDTSAQDEWNLDTQTSTGMAQSVKHLYLYDASTLTDADLARAINAFAAQDVAQAASASLGECDAFPYVDGAMFVDDQIFEEAVVQGQSFFASSGDTGSSCAVAPTNGVPGSGPPDTNYPASSTWVTAVGGTTLITTSNNQYVNEVAWNAGGGGASALEYPGWWQSNANPAYPGLGALGAGRGVPDIAMDADLTTGALIYINKQQYLVGGTSLSSPLALGSWARVQSAHGNRLGDAAINFYRLYNAVNTSQASRNPVPGFHDIVAGVNGAYSATPGWDFTTGIGSLNIAALDKALGAAPRR